MWIRRHSPVLARMPSMRPAHLNPRAPVLLVPDPAASRAAAPAAGKAPAAVPPAGKRGGKGASTVAADNAGRDDDTRRAGGFHESSYELQSGLQITESEWPDDVTVPGELGSR